MNQTAPSSNRRFNQSVRVQAQQWFEALRSHLAAVGAQNDILGRLSGWATLEDVLGECPQLVPPLLTMAWQLRHEPGFIELFQTASGAVAEDTTVPLKPCGKSFENIVLAQLHGGMRAYCERQEQAWLAEEKRRAPPPWFVTAPIIGPLLRRILRRRDEDIVRHYPQHGLYLRLKPWLRHTSQFALIESLATLPTATVNVLGATTVGLARDSAIRNLAALESRKCKFIVGLAKVFAESFMAGDSQRNGVIPESNTGAPRSDLGEVAGLALTHLTADGLHLVKGIIAVRENAQDIVMKLSVPMGHDLWRVFADSSGAMNVAYCPVALVIAIGEKAARANRKTLEALNSLPDQRATEAIATALLDAAGRDALTQWVTESRYVSVWLRMIAEIKQALTQRGESAVTPEAITSLCHSLIPNFAALNDENPPIADSAPTAVTKAAVQ